MTHHTGAVPEYERAADWRDAAICRNDGYDPDEFFPPNGTNGTTSPGVRHAKAICHLCPSRLPCGQWALATQQEYGVWGGLSESERRAILRRRARVREVSDEAAAV